MLSFFRRMSKSRVGTYVLALVGVGILAGFALGDISNFGTGKLGFGMNSSTLATVGGEEVTDREMSDAMQRRLQQIRQQQDPNADYASIARDFDPLLDQLIDERAMVAFADKYGFRVSKRLIDAEISQIPGARGLNGEFSQQAYLQFLSQQQLTDPQLRQYITASLLQRLMLTPIATDIRMPIGMATPYASMLLEAREGEAAIVPVTAFSAGLKPSDADLQAYYSANRARYTIPEQRSVRIARIGPAQVAAVAASDQEIAAYYNANKAAFGAKETRNLSQAVVPDQASANAIAARARAGGTLAAAAAPAGANAAVTSLPNQSRQAYASLAGDKAAAAAFSAASGTVVGPVQSDFGWVVVKVDKVDTQSGKSLEQAHSEIAARLTAAKRKTALADLYNRIQNGIDDGQNFDEAANQAKLAVETTPLIMGDGKSRTNPAFKLPPDLTPIVKPAFDLAPNDPPEMVTLPGEAGFALVSPAQLVAVAPAPLASIRDLVAKQWIDQQAMARARKLAESIAAKASGKLPLSDAVKQAGVPLPAIIPVAARRIQLAEASGKIRAPIRMLFTLKEGASRAVADDEGRGYFVVKVDKIVPGNALAAPALIGQMQKELQRAASQDYAQQFVAAIRADLKVKRNDKAIQAAKNRLASSGS
jgi:peptidyl-prolyl cis-trans isomerase D